MPWKLMDGLHQLVSDWILMSRRGVRVLLQRLASKWYLVRQPAYLAVLQPTLTKVPCIYLHRCKRSLHLSYVVSRTKGYWILSRTSPLFLCHLSTLLILPVTVTTSLHPPRPPHYVLRETAVHLQPLRMPNSQSPRG